MRKRNLFVPLAVFLCVLTLAFAPRVLARDGEASGSSSSSSPSVTGTSSQSDTTTRATIENHATTDGQHEANQEVKRLEEQRHAAAEKRQEELRHAEAAKQETEAEHRRDEAFKKTCNERLNGFKTRMDAITAGLKKRSDTLDTVLTRVQAFVKDKNLSVPNYQALLTDVQAKKATVDAVHSAAAQNVPTFDCNSNAKARESFASFKDVARQESDAVQAYKKALRALIAAVKTAAQTAEGASHANQ